MEEKWMVTAKRADFAAIGKKYGIDPVIARIIRNREVVGDEAIREYLYGGVEQLHSPWELKDMETAAEILQDKIKEGKKIRIIGDYDIDGVSSTYILVTGLRRLGAIVDTYIPDRIADGYGMHVPLIEAAREEGIDTIVTCDNGIAAADEIRLAKEYGMTVIVTDHHEVPYQTQGDARVQILPPADAVIDPKRDDCRYPFKGLCGGAVAFKLITAMYENYGIPQKELGPFLEIAAIATVGDVMELQGENRVLVKEGLKLLNSTSNLGLRELIKATGLEGKPLSAYHIGFILGPCINASGRLDTASRALKLLQAEDIQEAARLAGDLFAMNSSRKDMTAKGVEEAMELVESTSLKQDRILVVYLPDCHESLAGIIAGRLREAYHRPSFVLTKTKEGMVKGSGRSIEAYSMYDGLVECSGLLQQFGGHPMAAGLSLAEEQVPLFREKLNALCKLTEADLIPKVVIDVPMPISYVSRSLVEQLSLLEPFGKGNAKPLFAQKAVRLIGCRIIGKNRNVVKMQVDDGGGSYMEGIYFGDAQSFMDAASKKGILNITYYPSINSYQGRETLQITIQNYADCV